MQSICKPSVDELCQQTKLAGTWKVVVVVTEEQSNIIQGVRYANIQLSAAYPVVSAYEFEFLKGEELFREGLDNCTIYMIVQRPLTYFDCVEIRDGFIYFEIADGKNQPMKCRIDPVAAKISLPGETLYMETQFFSETLGTVQPLRDVAGIKLFKEDGSFILWWSPQKLLYEYLVDDLRVETTDDADPLSFLDFDVLYIGKAFSQKVWNRLTGHDKMQKILTVQNPISAGPAARAPFEIALVLLKVVGLTDVPQMPYMDLGSEVSPILHDIDLYDEDALERFLREVPVALGDEAMTREVEAQLINTFQPKFNDVKFANYPMIEGGMRSKGYSSTELVIERLPAFLRTAHHSVGPILAANDED
ncbi:hypothetical protein [Asaia lannensis]|uniref:hypothetical protein n=1 Tax=Asaia lannensis TaxID=415421 RepID=UPI003873B50E